MFVMKKNKEKRTSLTRTTVNVFTSRIKASLFDKKQNLLFVGKEHSFFIG